MFSARSSKAPAGRRQRKLCKEKPSPRVPSGTSRRRGWRRLARPYGSQFLYLPTNSRPPTEKIRPQARPPAPAPRGARCRSARENWSWLGKGRWRQLAFGQKPSRTTIFLSQTSSVRAPAKSCSNAYPAFERFRYFRRGARGLRGLPYAGGGPTKAEITLAKHPTGAPGGRCLPAHGTGLTGEKNPKPVRTATKPLRRS